MIWLTKYVSENIPPSAWPDLRQGGLPAAVQGASEPMGEECEETRDPEIRSLKLRSASLQMWPNKAWKWQPLNVTKTFQEKPVFVASLPLLPPPHGCSSQKAADRVGEPSCVCSHSECWRRKRPRDQLRSRGSLGREGRSCSAARCSCSTAGPVPHWWPGSVWCSCCFCCSRCLGLEAPDALLALSCFHLWKEKKYEKKILLWKFILLFLPELSSLFSSMLVSFDAVFKKLFTASCASLHLITVSSFKMQP